MYISDQTGRGGGQGWLEGWTILEGTTLCMVSNIHARGGVQTRLSFFSLLYGTPANRAESQQLEAWPASIYGHLREG